MKILIIGAGAIGVYLGVKLHSKNHDVKLFGRRKLMQVKKTAIIDNKKFNVPEKVFHIPKNENCDFLFITAKLYDFNKMVNLIKKNKIKSSIISSIQNGLVDTSKYSKILKNKIIPVTIFSGFNLVDGKIETYTTKIGWKTELSADGKKVSKLLLSIGIPCTADKNYNSMRAEKTIVNCCLNALSAIENKPFSELFKNGKTRERIEKLFYECYQILKKEHLLDDAEKMKQRMIKNWAKLNHYSSTCQDIHSGRKNEAKFFNGYIIHLGKKHNLPVKYNKEILNDINNIAKNGI